MDETEKYKQRLEAIAEKRRLQEEQDKAKRAKEDESLRQRQLKRKSLRDQWLMEGGPSSPLSPNTQKTDSSLWATQDQDMENHTEKLQLEKQQVISERDNKMEAVKVAESQTGRLGTPHGEPQEFHCSLPTTKTPDDEIKLNQDPAQGEAVVVTNGGGGGESSNYSASGPIETSPAGPVGTTEDGRNVEIESERSVAAAEFSQPPNANSNNEGEQEGGEGTLVMRAECVYITDEGEDFSGDLSSYKDQQESMQNPVGGQELTEVLEQVVKTEEAPETLPEAENGGEAEQPVSKDGGDVKGGTEPNTDADEETEADVKTLEVPDGPQPQSPTNALDSTVALVPVYAETPSSAFISESGANSKGQAPAVSEEAGDAVKGEEPACELGEFQEVLLADPRDDQSPETQPGEQDGLLQKVQAPGLSVESPGSNNLDNSGTQSPSKSIQGEKSETAKQKTCQCCSLM